jgi:hypothetical protein
MLADVASFLELGWCRRASAARYGVNAKQAALKDQQKRGVISAARPLGNSPATAASRSRGQEPRGSLLTRVSSSAQISMRRSSSVGLQQAFHERDLVNAGRQKEIAELVEALLGEVPRRVIDKMVAEGQDRTVGGATSIGAAHEHGFELFYAVEPVTPGQPAARRIFNGLDLDTEVGQVGQYVVAANGIA